MNAADPLSLFLPPVQRWFRTTLGEPTPAQRLGWPLIAAGKNTLILAPTGSGKTLAAFLACLDGLWRILPEPEAPARVKHGVRVLYISPLKALNNDIYRNLQVPLEGVAATARAMDFVLPALEVGIRSGDTPPPERQRLIRRPPHVLITTPESLHLLLTSRGRETLGGLTHVIIDEIHALCPNKRGVFLALLLERLAALNPLGFVRIGLSATQRPLEEVGRFLGGCEFTDAGQLRSRPVEIVDAGLRKDLDLRVLSPVEHFGPLPEKTIWPYIYRQLADLIKQHRSTIIFTNNRRTVERITANLNALADEPESLAGASGSEALLARAHHGSVALEVRKETEEALKEGRLPAVVATASLELGIDMGAVDLVCQVESPGNVARALQRVGRAGHLVGQRSKGRLIPKTLSDLLEQAVLVREMIHGQVEAMRVPINCLDVLAQQIVAMVAMEDWKVDELYTLIRRAYPFRDLTPAALESVLEMITGRYRFNPIPENDGARRTNPSTSMTALQPRISWDRAHHRLRALPGSQQLALINGGTIPDTGQYAVYTEGGVRVGEVDEEFVYERRVGEAFLLGTTAWRILDIATDRVLVAPAEGAPAMAPFWRGESTGRSYDLGLAIGRFLREVGGQLDDRACIALLQEKYHLDEAAARNLRLHVMHQLARVHQLPTDRHITIEASRDPLGDWQVVILSPLGARLHFGLRLVLEGRLRDRLGYTPQCLHHDDGILIRLTDSEEPILDLLEGLKPDNIQDLILNELSDSALFALRFRQNAARALLMPRAAAGKRAPLWLQRLRGKDLLQVARKQADFPIVAETFRECLHDHLDVPRLQQLLGDIATGQVTVSTHRLESPSPFAATLLFRFNMAYQYQYDDTEADPSKMQALNGEMLDQLVSPERHAHLLDPRAIHQVDRRLRGLGMPPRSATEMAEWLRRLGDLAPSDLEGPMAGFLDELERDGRAVKLVLPAGREPSRWVLTEELAGYRQAFGLNAVEPEEQRQSAATILHRFLTTHALVGLRDVLDHYPFEADWTKQMLQEWAENGRVISVRREDGAPLEWSAPENLEQVQRGSLAVLRREVTTCSTPQYVDFLLRWQGVHPDSRQGLNAGVRESLTRLQQVFVPMPLWEQTVLASRVPEYQGRWLDECIQGGEWVWIGWGEQLAFLPRAEVRQLAPLESPDLPALEGSAQRVFDALHQRGAMFLADLALETGLPPSAVRAALWVLVRRGLVTNDQFDVVRRGEETPVEQVANGAHLRRGAGRRRANVNRPEGRWSLLPWGRPAQEVHAVRQAELLLQRYGIVARELAQGEGWLPPWRVLYEVYSRMELAGSVRRGYFVEGLSGAQFATLEAARLLEDLALPSTASAPAILLHSQDPANLFGSGAPLEVPLLDGGERSLLRRSGNWLVIRAGRPVLLIEQQGKKLTALASASREDLAAAVACLPEILKRDQTLAASHRLTVTEWNEQPVAGTPGRELLEAAGFVRDYQSMTLYAAWR